MHKFSIQILNLSLSDLEFGRKTCHHLKESLHLHYSNINFFSNCIKIKEWNVEHLLAHLLLNFSSKDWNQNLQLSKIKKKKRKKNLESEVTLDGSSEPTEAQRIDKRQGLAIIDPL